MLHGEMTDYGHVTIIGVLLEQIISVFLGIYNLTRFVHIVQVYGFYVNFSY